MEQLRAQNKRLRLECEIMTEQVDMYNNGSSKNTTILIITDQLQNCCLLLAVWCIYLWIKVPLGETSEEFYREIYAGQDANSLVRNTAPATTEVGRWPRGSGRGKPPPRPPPPRFLYLPSQQQPQQYQQAQTQSGEWCCTMCTFRNHPDLNQCEQCQMVRVPPSSKFLCFYSVVTEY